MARRRAQVPEAHLEVDDGLASCPFNFGGLPKEFSDYDRARVVVLPVSYDATSSFIAGTREGPRAIIYASRNLEFFDLEMGREIREVGIATLDEIQPSVESPKKAVESVQEKVAKVLADGKLPLLLGGDHTISIGAIRALKERGGDFSILQLDAHADFRDSYQGSSFSHACVGMRFYEECRLVQVGVRSMSRAEYHFIKANRIVSITSWDFLKEPAGRIRAILKATSPRLYITIDLDVVDPAEMPAVGNPEPGGLRWKDITYLMFEISKRRDIIGVDLVELCPIPGNIAPDFMAAKLAYKMVGYMTMRGG